MSKKNEKKNVICKKSEKKNTKEKLFYQKNLINFHHVSISVEWLSR